MRKNSQASGSSRQGNSARSMFNTTPTYALIKPPQTIYATSTPARSKKKIDKTVEAIEKKFQPKPPPPISIKKQQPKPHPSLGQYTAIAQKRFQKEEFYSHYKEDIARALNSMLLSGKHVKVEDVERLASIANDLYWGEVGMYNPLQVGSDEQVRKDERREVGYTPDERGRYLANQKITRGRDPVKGAFERANLDLFPLLGGLIKAIPGLAFAAGTGFSHPNQVAKQTIPIVNNNWLTNAVMERIPIISNIADASALAEIITKAVQSGNYKALLDYETFFQGLLTAQTPASMIPGFGSNRVRSIAKNTKQTPTASDVYHPVFDGQIKGRVMDGSSLDDFIPPPRGAGLEISKEFFVPGDTPAIIRTNDVLQGGLDEYRRHRQQVEFVRNLPPEVRTLIDRPELVNFIGDDYLKNVGLTKADISSGRFQALNYRPKIELNYGVMEKRLRLGDREALIRLWRGMLYAVGKTEKHHVIPRAIAKELKRDFGLDIDEFKWTITLDLKSHKAFHRDGARGGRYNEEFRIRMEPYREKGRKMTREDILRIMDEVQSQFPILTDPRRKLSG